MWLLMIEAGVALFLLVFIVWWTMYQGPQASHDDVDDKVDTTAAPAADKTDRPDSLPR